MNLSFPALLRCSSARLGAAGLALFGSAAPVHAQGQPGTVPVCFTDFPPYVGTELPDGGTLGALAKRAFAATGLTVQAIKAPWARAFALAKNGECILMTMWRNEERDALFRYSLPVARMQLGFFVRTDRKKPVPADANVAFQRGSYLPPELAEGRYRLNPVVDMHPAMQMLALGRVEAVFSERASFEFMLAKEAKLPAELRWMGPPLEVKTTFMAISKTHPQADAWLEALNQEIRQSVKN